MALPHHPMKYNSLKVAWWTGVVLMSSGVAVTDTVGSGLVTAGILVLLYAVGMAFARTLEAV